MRRLEIIKDTVYTILEQECSKAVINQAIEHLNAVSLLATLLAKKRQLDFELAAISGILHDLATYKYHNSFDHANRSSLLAREILQNSKLFTNKEICLITIAIANHSTKDIIQDENSEVIKDADVLASYLNEPDCILNPTNQKRLNQLLVKL